MQPITNTVKDIYKQELNFFFIIGCQFSLSWIWIQDIQINTDPDPGCKSKWIRMDPDPEH